MPPASLVLSLLSILLYSVLTAAVIPILAFQDNNTPPLPPPSNQPSIHEQAQPQPQPQPQSHSHSRIMRTAWHCHGRNQKDLVQNLMEAGIVRQPVVAQVMTLVDRKYYLPKLSSLYGGDATAQLYPYVDAPQSIGHGQTISGEWNRTCFG